MERGQGSCLDFADELRLPNPRKHPISKSLRKTLKPAGAVWGAKGHKCLTKWNVP